MKPLLLFAWLVLLLAPVARADFADDLFPAEPDILARVVAAAQAHGAELGSSGDAETAYYLRSAEYVGPVAAPFGPVHIAQLIFVRSATRGSRQSARGHTFVVFLDRTFTVRAFWRVDAPLDKLSTRGACLLHSDAVLFDYDRPAANGEVVVDGKPQSVPRWP